jgi:drug/metabolite transporter (DMT)-like permease
MNKTLKTGIILAITTAIISGFSVFYNKLVVITGIDSTIFNIIKNGGVGIFLTFFLLLNGTLSKVTKLTKNEWIKLIAIAGIGGSIPFILFFEGLKTVPAATGNVLNKSMFIWVALLALPFLGESIKPLRIIGYGILAASIFFAIPSFHLTASRGEFYIVTATFLWAIEVIIAKKALATIDSSIVAWARMAIGTIFLIGFAATQGKIGQLTHISSSSLYAIIPSILLLTGYVTTWMAGLKRAPATTVTSILILAAPITTVLSVAFIPKTMVSSPLLILLPIIGIAFLIYSAKRSATTTNNES